MNIDPRAMQVITALDEAGGKPYIVGGFVRDLVMGLEPNDYDIEVYGLSVSDIGNALRNFSYKTVGMRFGVFNVTVDGLDIQVVPPRRENKVGAGHKGFVVEFDPTMTMLEAAKRRDFTINSMALDPFTMEIYDPFGAQTHIQKKILIHTSDHFSEDPMRVLRGMQFAGRFNMWMSKQTFQKCQALLPEYDTLPKEAIFSEWWKWAVKSVKPSKGLDVLFFSWWIEKYPELSVMTGIVQDRDYHPEGGVWAHAYYAVDRAADIADREHLFPEEKGILVMAALLHDVGKSITTTFKAGHIVSPGHDKAGEPLAESFLKSIGFPFNQDGPSPLTKKIINLVGCHMRHLNEPSRKSALRLSRDIYPASIEMLAMLVEADNAARPPLLGGLPLNMRRIRDYAREARAETEPVEAILKGRDLIAMGMKEGPQIGKILKDAYEAQLNEEFFDYEGALEWFKNTPTKA